jgi:hypothetical protein
MSVDYNTDVGKVRLRIGDVGDLPFLGDDIIYNVLQENNGNLSKASQQCAQFILAQLSFKSHKKMVQLEIWGSEAFQNYRTFLIDTISNPAFMSNVYPIPYSVSTSNAEDPINTFISNWNNNWNTFTVDENMSMTAWGSNVNP